MLIVILPADADYPEDIELKLEHSLVSLSEWEAVYEKPFFSLDPKTPEETADYFRMMVVGLLPKPDFIEKLTPETAEKISKYINAKRSATWFTENPNERKPNSRQVITSELVYSWLIRFRIPFDPAESWHFNRLMTTVKIVSEQNTPPKKMTPREAMAEQSRLNDLRRQQSGSAG